MLPLKPKEGISGNLNSYAHSASEAHWSDKGLSVYITPDELCPLGCETPRINYDVYNGKPYRYFYAISSDVDAENPGTVRQRFYFTIADLIVILTFDFRIKAHQS